MENNIFRASWGGFAVLSQGTRTQVNAYDAHMELIVSIYNKFIIYSAMKTNYPR